MTVAATWILLAVVADPSNAPVQVAGATTCPTAAEVESDLAGLIGPRDPDLPADVATLADDAGSVVVALRRGSAGPLGDKRIDPGLSCAQRARTAAVIIAAWEARLATTAPGLVGQQPPPQPGSAAVVVRQSEPPRPPRPPLRLEPGITAGASINGTTLAPTARFEIAFSRPDAIVVPALAGLFVGAHSKDVGPGDGSWRRYGLLATVASRRAWSATWIEASLGIALTWLDISGRSFPTNGSGVTFDPGVPFGVRAGVRSGPVRWWLDATLAFWPREQTLYVSGLSGSTTLPRGEVLLGLGASYNAR